jgi:cytochrome c-type biogenesis protein CcmF
MAVGVVGSRVYTTERDVRLPKQEPVEVGDYTLTYESLSQEPESDHLTIAALISVARNGRSLVSLKPTLRYYQSSEQSIRVPALRPGMQEDLYLVLAGWSDNADAVSLQVTVNPLINFLWLGGLVFLAGGGFALWPPGQQGILNAVAAMIGVGLLLGAGWAMWGLPHGAVRSADRGLGVKQPAPEFEVPLLDGSTRGLPELRDEVTVIIFWNAQCPVCKEVLPQLQALWEIYREREVAIIGVAVGDDRSVAQDVSEELDIDYPIGLDTDGNIAGRYGITGVPETFVIDRNGEIAYSYVGALSMENLAAKLDELLIQP